MFHNLLGWSNTNSNIESFNATIKRDFSLRKRCSMWGSVDIIEEIILNYSTCKKEFWVTPKFDKDTKAQGKRCIIGPFKQRSIYIYSKNIFYIYIL
jgi:hypothetical protein